MKSGQAVPEFDSSEIQVQKSDNMNFLSRFSSIGGFYTELIWMHPNYGMSRNA